MMRGGSSIWGTGREALSLAPSACDVCEILKTGPPLAISGPSCDTQRADRTLGGTVAGSANISTVENTDSKG